MKKIFTLVIAGLLLMSGTSYGQDLFISEVADPSDVYQARFVELYNPTASPIDLAARNLYLVKQTGDSRNASDIALTGTIAAGATYVIANSASAYTDNYGGTADQATSSVSGNGDDGYYLFEGGGYGVGTLLDGFGVLDEDGTGKAWEYTDSRAERVFGIDAPNATWTASEWKISPAAVADMDPGVHAPLADVTAPVWAEGYPMADNIVETSFDIAMKLDETSTVYYVVLEFGAAAPSIEEVVAGTGAAGAAAVAAGSTGAGTSESTVNITGLTTDATYTVYLVAEDAEPNRQDALATFDVTPTVPPSVIHLADFESGLDPFVAYSDSGDNKNWYQTGGYAKMNGYQSDTSEYDWLISPEMDFENVTEGSVEFSAYWNYGINDETHSLKLFYSEDYDGNTANIHTATWVELPFPLPEKKTWTDIGPIDVSFLTSIAYFAFVYDYPDDANFSEWRIDNAQVLGYVAAGTDATLSDLLIDAVQVEGFESAKLDYVVELAAGETVVPTVTYTTADENATAVVTPASDLAGDAAARTTTIVVTAQDETTTMTYTILFNPILEVSDLAALRAASDLDRKYTVTGEVVLTQKDGYRNKKYIEDANAAIEIDDPDEVITTDYAIGDGITGVTGTLNSYFGMLQLAPSADPGVATTTGNAVDPQVVSVTDFVTNHEDYEAEFVKIEGVTFADAGGTFDDGKNYVVSVGEDQTVFRTAFYGVLSSTIPAMADIQGVAIWHYDEAKVAPRMASDLMAYSSDATLADLTVDGETVEDFAAGTMSYEVELEFGYTGIPAVVADPADDNASAAITPVSDLTGDEAARTATIVVTAQDGSTETYTIIFTVSTIGIELNTIGNVSVYPVPANTTLFIEGLEKSGSLSIVSITGKVIQSIDVTGDKMSIDISELDAGFYMILSDDSNARFVKN